MAIHLSDTEMELERTEAMEDLTGSYSVRELLKSIDSCARGGSKIKEYWAGLYKVKRRIMKEAGSFNPKFDEYYELALSGKLNVIKLEALVK